ncbi:MAG: hypothetical protein KF900_09405 [Bacteroidetes bacterium]|nr:hypothetical protein [Bacteroidota bacterium]
MPIQFDNFDQQKIDRLKNHLVSMAQKGKAKHYEIFVDNLKAVPKTDEPNDFDAYEDYMNADTEQIRILIYNSSASPRNDQYVFMLKARNRTEANNIGLNGFETTKPHSKTSLNDWREEKNKQSAEQRQIAVLLSENEELREELEERENEIEEYRAAIKEAKANGNKIGGIHLGDVLSLALEGLVKRNTHLLAKLPATAGLAGLIEQENKTDTNENAEVSFSKKDNSTLSDTAAAPALSEEEQTFIRLMRELEKLYSEEEMSAVMELLDFLSKDKTQLQILIDFLSQEDESEDEQEEQQ